MLATPTVAGSEREMAGMSEMAMAQPASLTRDRYRASFAVGGRRQCRHGPHRREASG